MNMEQIAEEIRTHVDKKIEELTSGPEYVTRMSTAKLLRGVGVSVREVDVEQMGAELVGCPDEVWDDNDAKEAIHTALSLWAKHQHGKSYCAHCPGEHIGYAIHDLLEEGENEHLVYSRVERVLRAHDPHYAANDLAVLVYKMRTHDICLDYAALAADLYRLQNPDNGVKLDWSRKICFGGDSDEVYH